jgi:Sulfotransferase family
MAIKPIFVFSVSRSGSTLVQRIIAAHDGVATASEPWLLLPYAYTLRPRGVDAEYMHPLMVDAIADFCQELPRGSEDYKSALRDCMLRLYEQAAGANARHFVDKSPPYCLVASEIMDLFPDGRFVFLWRNPLSIVASMIETWEPWCPTLFGGDLFTGLPRLVAAYRQGAGRAYSVRFEDLVVGDEHHWRPLMDYLEIGFERDALQRFSQVQLSGRMGDPTGVKRYSSLSPEPSQKWKGTLANPLRRAWCRRYLNYLGAERLAVMGYDRDELLRELDSQPPRMDALLPDIGRLIKDVAKEPIRVWTRNRKIGGPNVIRALLRA